MSPDGLVLVTTGSRSNDGGVTWSATSDNHALPIAVAGQPSQFYAAVQGLTSYDFSSDGGASWKPAGMTLTDPNGKGIHVLVPVGPQPGVIYATNYDSTSAGGILRSADGGHTWNSIDAGLGQKGWAIAVSPASTAVVYAWSGTGLYRSGDSGATWRLVRPGHLDQVVADARDPATFYVVTGASIATSRDGGATFSSSSPDTVNLALSLIADPVSAGRAYEVGGDGAAFRTLDYGASWQRIALRESLASSPGPAPQLAISAGATRLFQSANYTIESLPIPDVPIVLGTATWWNPAESGWGVSMSQHADRQVVAVWYYYDASGKPRWAIVPGGTWLDAHTFAGAMYTTRWPGFAAGLRNASDLVATPAGSATFHFADGKTADVSFVFNDGTRSDKHIVMQEFAPGPLAWSGDYSDLWWNPYQSGWGLVIQQRGGTAFTTMFVYDGSGDPTWLVVPETRFGTAVAAGTYTADLFTTTGPPYTGPFDPSKVVATRSGTFALTLGETTWLTYTTNASSPPPVAIEREPF
jgi:photosystem II stability/assembly factor-like uncharacterized protein